MGVTGTEEGNPESHACYRARVPMQRRQRRIAKQRRSTTWRRIADSGTPIRISVRGASRVATSCSGQLPLGWRLRSPSGSLRLTDVAAQDATPGTGVPPAAPTSGTEGQTRGAGGELKLLQWQAPTTLNMHLAGSFKDQLAACLVTEPLIHFLPDATPIPCLVTEVPSQANGRVAADLKTVTYTLQDGIVWSDGEPLTAEDVVFTWKWIVDPANQSSNAALYEADCLGRRRRRPDGQHHLQRAPARLEQLLLIGAERRHLARAHPRCRERRRRPPSR